MEIKVYPDYKTLCRATADLIVDYLSSKKNSLVCLASGHTPRGVFEFLVQDVENKRLDLSACTFVSLDEWIGIGARENGSCRNMMDEDFFGPLQIPESQIIFFDGKAANQDEEVNRVNRLIDANGGLDIMLVGVGTNGHIAMNEPGTSFEAVAHISTLAEETKIVGQKYFSTATDLSKGITLGLKHFREARLPILMANGSKKTSIMQKIFLSTPDEMLPGSVIHLIPQGFVMLDSDAGTSGE